jgi:hypothetical protein
MGGCIYLLQYIYIYPMKKKYTSKKNYDAFKIAGKLFLVFFLISSHGKNFASLCTTGEGGGDGGGE